VTKFKVHYSMRGCLIEQDDFDIVKEVMQQECLSGQGPYTMKFQDKFAKYCGVPYAHSCCNGTVALDIAAQALDLKPGDEVLTSAISFIATSLAPLRLGTKVKFIDIDPRTMNMDPAKVEEQVTKKTRAIFLVHLGGQMCDMDPIMEIARKHNLKVVEDAAHAPGASYKGRKAGSIGDIGTFSFHTWKNMTTLGEGGMVVCKDPQLSTALDRLKRFGSAPGPYTHPWECTEGELPWYHDFKIVGRYYGSNYRMSDVQAAMGITQLDKLDRANDLRREFAHYLTQGLAGVEEVTTPFEDPNGRHVFHLYNIQFESQKLGVGKEALLRPLWEEYGIECWIQYVPCYLLGVHRETGHKPGECPVAEEVFRRKLISLPIGPTMTKDQADYVIRSIKEIIAKISARRTSAAAGLSRRSCPRDGRKGLRERNQ